LKISIVTPCYNAEKYIAETIESVIGQGGDFRIEYIVVDGASTDGTLEIVEHYRKRIETGLFPVRCRGAEIKLVSEKDRGMYEALAKGLKASTGEAVAYINADDFYQPNAFDAVSRIFKKYGAVHWLTGIPVLYDERGKVAGSHLPLGYDRKLILKGMYGRTLPFIQQESIFFRRDLIKSIDLEKLGSFRLAGDYYLWATFAKHTDLYLVHAYLSGFRTRHGQLSSDRSGYLKELGEIAGRSNAVDHTRAFLTKIAEHLLPVGIKKAAGRKTIYLDHKGEWRLRP